MTHASETTRDLSQLVIQLDAKTFRTRHLSGIILPQFLQALAEDANLEHPFQVDITLLLENDRWQITGMITGGVELTCSRCLDPFVHDMSVEVDRAYKVAPDVTSRLQELEMIEDLVYLEDGQFSVSMMVEEELVLALPFVPLCRESCKGLCQKCGAELNREPCQCNATDENSPFAILKGRL